MWNLTKNQEWSEQLEFVHLTISQPAQVIYELSNQCSAARLTITVFIDNEGKFLIVLL